MDEPHLVALTAQRVGEWAQRAMGSTIASVEPATGNLSRVVTARLVDGRDVVIKVRTWEPRLVACAAVQSRLAAADFPCPVLIAGPDLFDGWAISAEQALPGGEQLPADGAAPLYAQLLADLISLAPRAEEVPELESSPPWVAWNHRGSGLWPDRDDAGRDLNAVSGPAWLDDAAATARFALLALSLPRVVGHGDFESQNIRWNGRTPYVVHDWDSVISQPEPAIVGAAAAVWPATGERAQAASTRQTAEFIDAYIALSAKAWSRSARRAAWAAGIWVRAFNAKKEAALGGPELDLLATDIDARLAHLSQ